MYRGKECRCFTTIKLPSREELDKWAQMTDEERAKYHFTGEVSDMPKQFTDWMENNAERLENAKNKPYFITDNYVDGDISKGLRFEQNKVAETIEPAKGATKKEAERYLNDPDYADSVKYNPENGGLMATHKDHKEHPNDNVKYFPEQLTGDDLEKEFQELA